MAYESVKNQIDAYIKANGVNLITGPVLNAVLTTMLDELGEGYAFQGVLNTTDTPSPAADIPQAWLASAGTYLGGSITVDEGELALIIHTSDGWSKETVYRGVQLSYEAIVAAIGYTPADDADLAEKQDTIADLSAIRSGATLGSTSVQPVDIENMVEAEPIGSIVPPVNPSEFATKESVDQLGQEVDDIKSSIDYGPNSIQTSVQYTGRYINNDGGFTNSTNFQVSAPIRLLKGEKIVASLAAYSIISAISRTNEAGTEFTPIVLGAGSTLSLIEYEYIAAEDCYVALCGYVGNFPSSVSVYNSVVISDIKKDVYFLDSLLKTAPVDNIAAVSDYVPGKYVNYLGNISTISGDTLSVAVEKIVGAKTLHYKGRLSANTYIGLYNSPDMSSASLVSILLGSASTTDYDQDIIIPTKGEFWLGISGVSVSTLNPKMSVVDYYDAVDLSYFEIENKVNNENHIYVGANREIKTIFAAFEAVGDGTQYKKNIIHLDAESFNVFDGVDLSEKNTAYRGLDVPNYTYIVGQGVDKTIILGSIPTGYDNLDYNNISTLNMEFVGGCKNLTIRAHNIRYCIHTDCMLSNDQERKSEINHENVKFYHDGLDDGVVATAMAYGLGCRSNSHTVFENCEFINNSGGRVTFNLHNNQAALLPSLVEFHNCVFNNLSYSDAGVLSIMSEGTGNSDKVVLNGCNFNGGISMKRLSDVNIFDQDIVGGGNGNCRVTIAGGVGIEKLSIDGFENLYSIATLSPGDAVSLLTFNRAEKATNKNLIYGVALTSATSGQKVKVQTQGLIQASIVGIGGSDGDLVSLVNSKLAVSSADPIGVVVCGGNFIKLF